MEDPDGLASPAIENGLVRSRIRVETTKPDEKEISVEDIEVRNIGCRMERKCC